MGECKTTAIQSTLGTFRHNQTYRGIIQAHSGIFRTSRYPDTFKTVVCQEPWHIQNQKHIQNPGVFATLLHSEPRYIQNAGIFKIWGTLRLRWSANYFHGYNYFHKLKLFSQSLLSWNKYLEVVSPKVVMLCKKLWRAREVETGFLIYLSIYSNKLVYLQLITVLVYRSSPSKSHGQGYLNF